MIAAGEQRRRLPTFTRALLSLAILVALWLFRPGLPSLPRSFSAPLTIDTIEGFTERPVSSGLRGSSWSGVWMFRHRTAGD